MLASGLSSPSSNGGGMVVASLSSALVHQIGQHFKQQNQEGQLSHLLAQSLLGAATAAATQNDILTGAISVGGAEAAAPL